MRSLSVLLATISNFGASFTSDDIEVTVRGDGRRIDATHPGQRLIAIVKLTGERVKAGQISVVRFGGVEPVSRKHRGRRVGCALPHAPRDTRRFADVTFCGELDRLD